MDSRKKSLVKSITWRIICIIVSFIVAQIFTGDVFDSMIISIVINIVNFFLYYIHERIWVRVK